MIIYVQLTAHPGRAYDVLRGLSEVASATRHEPGALSYAVHQEQEHPERLSVYERYRDAAACDAHMRSEAVQHLLQRFETLLSEPPRITVLRWHAGFGMEGV